MPMVAAVNPRGSPKVAPLCFQMAWRVHAMAEAIAVKGEWTAPEFNCGASTVRRSSPRVSASRT